MKVKIVSIAVILPVLIVLGIASMVYTRSLAEEHVQAVGVVEARVRAGDMDGARRAHAEIEARWTAVTPLLRLWIYHADIDEVEARLKGLKVGLEVEYAPMIFDSAASLVQALNHLHHLDDLTLGNIL